MADPPIDADDRDASAAEPGAPAPPGAPRWVSTGPRTRRFALTAHVITSVGWLGAVAAFLALAVTGLTTDDPQLVRAVHLAAEPLTAFLIIPLALGSLLTGIVQSLGTTWGLLRHYWVIFKLLIAVVATVVLLLYTRTVGSLADIAAQPGGDLDALRAATFVLHSGAALVLLIGATVLAVYKPRGMTRYGWRKQHERRASSSPPQPARADEPGRSTG